MGDKWKYKSLKEKAADLTLYGAIVVPVLYGVKYGFYAISAAMGDAPGPDFIDDVVASPDTYGLAAGLTIGRGLFKQFLEDRLDKRFGK